MFALWSLMSTIRPGIPVIRLEFVLSLLSLIVVGGLVGWIASEIAGTNRQMSFLSYVVVGIIGAFVTGFVFWAVAGVRFERGLALEFSTCGGFILAVLGAVIFLAVVNAIQGGRG